jgi:hypothetical protein
MLLDLMKIHILVHDSVMTPCFFRFRRLSVFIPLLTFLCLAPLHLLLAQQIIHVPADQPDLSAAISVVGDGGIIEMAAGTYQAPQGGYTIYDLPSPKAFTVRAAAGASVTFTGSGSTDILRIAPSSMSNARPITFDHLIFSNGATTSTFIGGAITLVNAQAIFTSCTFQNSAANSPVPGTGGGAQWIAGSIVYFDSCTWTGNTSPSFGAGMSVLGSRVYVSNSRFSNNRVDLPGHAANAAGGAISINDSTVSVSNSSFDNNRAGYVGGAIFAIGLWKSPANVPATDVTIRDCAFNGNAAQFDAAFNPPPLPAIGGAVHFEGQTTAKVFNCRFNSNTARQGGALSNYLAITEINGCVFKNNTATGTGQDEGLGGTIIALSAESGTVDHRPSQLTISDTLVQGGGPGVPSAHQGGGIFAAGDLNFAYGLGGSPQTGIPEDNRTKVQLTRVTIADVTAIADGALPGTGGAFMGAFVDLTMDASIIENCTSTDSGAAIQLIQNSSGNVNNTVISHCSSGSQGAGVTLYGSTLNMSGSSLVNNHLNSLDFGVAITSAPSVAAFGMPAYDVSGLIQNCVFSNNNGSAITIYDGDRSLPPFNRLQYGGNQFFPEGANFYFNDAFGSQSILQLNSFVMPRSDGTQTIKAPFPNTAPNSEPIVGALLMIPPTILQTGAPGETLPIPSYLVYSVSGGSAILDGATQNADAGVVVTSSDGPHTLMVTSSISTPPPPPAFAANISTRLPVGTDQNVLIGGFIIQGPVAKRVIIRAIGPSLNGSLSGALQDPTLELHDGTGALIGSNDNWHTTQIGGVIGSNQTIDIVASGVAPSSDAESAIIATLNPGAYTAIVRGTNNTTGIALVEVYDLDAVAASTLANISTRGFVQTGDNVMIGGFILLGGAGPTKIVVRGIGPSLAGAGVLNPLSDPTLELHDGNGALVGSNDDWQASPDAAVIQAAGLQPSNGAESAIYATGLPRGAYTAILSGKNGATGIAVVEVYVFQ